MLISVYYEILRRLPALPHTRNGHGHFVLVNIANLDLLRSYTTGKVHGHFEFLCVCKLYFHFVLLALNCAHLSTLHLIACVPMHVPKVLNFEI